MTVQPQPTEGVRADDRDDRRCPDCGSRVETDRDGRPFPVCRSCYDAYVEHAGR